MNDRSPLAGGFLLMIAILAGFALGAYAGEPTLGVIGGTVIGIVAALLLWLIDRRRRG